MLDFVKKLQKPLQGYKVTNQDRSRKVGIAANSLDMLRSKAEAKFNLTNTAIYLAADGTEVDADYFQTLPEQTVFICAPKDTKIETDYDLLLTSISKTEIVDTGKAIQSFIKDDRDHLVQVLLQAKRDFDEKVACSTRDEHEDWFQSLESSAFTKEEVMRRRSQDRIRGYFYKIKDELVRSEVYKKSPKGKKIILDILDAWKHLLAGTDYFSCMFDRSYDAKHDVVKNNEFTDEIDAARFLTKKRRIEMENFIAKDKMTDLQKLRLSLCSIKGDFRCFGEWSKTICDYQNHTINPYASRENLILFQTWNLDHQAELCRTVLPSLLENLEILLHGKAICDQHRTKAVHVSLLTYFKEIFTVANLKLVHIVCHDKGGHELKSNGRLICVKCNEYKFIQKLEKLIESGKCDGEL
ncbi:DNA fragmentation factor subunit beta [Culicoides brevitarsis]|uniref:DNA fragmentation factor subunit beta n=1 Tax=Culicoides brevitarsis TaxID=469753 RepID=UPI00307B3C0F